MKSGSTTKYKILKETFYLTTYQNYVTLKSGLAVTLNTNVNSGSISIKKVAPATKDTTDVNFTQEGNTYLLTDDITGELGTTYILELVYKTGIEPSIYPAFHLSHRRRRTLGGSHSFRGSYLKDDNRLLRNF